MKNKTFLYLTLLALVLFTGIDSAGALTLQEKVGGLIYRDTNLSLNFNQSCMTCHHPSAGFADPNNRRDPVNFPVSEGSVPGFFGGRNAPSAAYAGFSPILSNIDSNGDPQPWTGGMFWDGRATGATLGDPLAEQALGPFQNPIEMAIDPKTVVDRVATSPYACLFVQAYPGTDFNNTADTYDNIGRAVAASEKSTAVTKFTSKFDEYWAACQKKKIDVSTITAIPPQLPRGILTTRQLEGLALFNNKDKGNCSACHNTTNNPQGGPPLFTDYTYDNLGIPTNWQLYDLVQLGQPGLRPPDLGLGGFLESTGHEEAVYKAEYGKFKVPTLRNVAKSPPYGHNGYFSTLLSIVRFYNTRDVENAGWALPEYSDTMNTTELGNLGLTADEEWSLVVFMQALTDQGQ